MPLLTDLNVNPYYDDFDANNNYYRVLFKPQTAIQARELTTMQSMLQDQIEKFGDSIYYHGSVVKGGQQFYDQSLYSVFLQNTYANAIISNNVIANSVGLFAIGQTSGVINRVKAYVPRGATNPNILLYKPAVNGGGQPPMFQDAEVIELRSDYANVDTFVAYVQANTTNSFGYGSTFSIGESVYYINGTFVQTPQQTTVVNASVLTTNVVIGYNISESIVSSLEDSNLNDNALGYPNYNAPGADRLKIDLTLTTAPEGTSTSNTFVAAATIIDGLIYTDNRYPLYSVLGDTMARRTYETSGNFAATPFTINLKDVSSTSNVVHATISAGTAYVLGYEYIFYSPLTINLNKARSTDEISEAFIDKYYGNVVRVNNLTGPLPHINEGQLVELHSNTSGLANNSTLVGKANIRAFDYYSGNGATGIIYETSLFNIVSTSNNFYVTNILVQNAAAVNGYSSPSLKMAVDPTSITNSANISKFGPIINVYSTGTTSNYNNTDIITVTSPAGNATATIATNTVGGITAITISNSGAYFPSGTLFTQNSNPNAVYEVKIANSTGGSSKGTGGTFYANSGAYTITQLFDNNNDTLVFPVGQNNIANSSSVQYSYKKVYKDQPFFNGTATIYTTSLNDIFYGEATGDQIPSNEVIQFYQVAVTNTVSGSLTPGTVVPLDSYTNSNVTIPVIGDGTYSTAQVYLGDENIDFDGTADIEATIYTSSDIRKTKNLIQNSYLATSPMAPGTTTSLGVCDIYALNSVYDIGTNVFKGLYSNTTVYNKTDSVIYNGSVYISEVDTNSYDLSNTDSWSSANNILVNFTYDNGQRDAFYDFGSVTYSSGASVTTGNTVIVYDYFQHSGGRGYFSVDSYPVSYDTIPSYKTKNGNTLQLRDCYDFRPRRTDGSSIYTFDSFQLPLRDALSPMISDHTYYLSRIDKVILNKDGKFTVKSGKPGHLSPQYPSDNPDGMTMFILEYPAYTFKASDIKVQVIPHKRYTMQDIGTIDQRLTSVEYYTALTMGEQQLQTGTIAASNGVTLFKSGFLVDAFAGHNIGEVTNPDYHCAIDYNDNYLRASFNSAVYNHNTASAASDSKFWVSNNYLMLAYDEKPFLTQNYITETPEKPNPFIVITFIGKTHCDHDRDCWHDEDHMPECEHNEEDSCENWIKDPDCHHSEWNHWNTLVRGVDSSERYTKNQTGKSYSTSKTNDNDLATLQARYNYQLQNGADNDSLNSTYNQIINYKPTTAQNSVSEINSDISYNKKILPGDPRCSTEYETHGKIHNSCVKFYARTAEIIIEIYNLAPSSTHHIFINGLFTTSHCRWWNADLDDFDDFGKLLVSDRNGYLKVKLTIPCHEHFRFFSEDYLTIEICDNGVNVLGSASFGWSKYWIKGQPNDEDDIIPTSPRPLPLRQETGSAEVTLEIPPSGYTILLLGGQSGFFTTNASGSSKKFKTSEVKQFVIEEMKKLGDDESVWGSVSDSDIDDICNVYHTHAKRHPCLGEHVHHIRRRKRGYCTLSDIDDEVRKFCLAITINGDNDVSGINSNNASTIIAGKPFAAVFHVDPVNYPNGIYATSIDLLFVEETETVTVGTTTKTVVVEPEKHECIHLHLRPCQNGKPHEERHFPRSHCHKRPEEVKYISKTQITTQENIEKYKTRFQFEEPIYLAPGEDYSYIIETNSPKYSFHTAKIGGTDKITGRKCDRIPHHGPIFKQCNVSTWTEDETIMVTATLNHAQFISPASITFPVKPKANTFAYHLVEPFSDDITIPGVTSVVHQIQSREQTSNTLNGFELVNPNQNHEYNTMKIINSNSANDYYTTLTLSTNDTNVTPKVALNSLAALFAGNRINGYVDNKNNPHYIDEISYYGGTALAKYVTTPVRLLPTIRSTTLRVWLDLNVFPGMDIQVYYKVLNNYDDTAFINRPWVLMDYDPVYMNGKKPLDYYYSRTPDDYIEHAWSAEGITYTNPANGGSVYDYFNVFAIKVVMYSNNVAKVPRCQNLRVIAAS